MFRLGAFSALSFIFVQTLTWGIDHPSKCALILSAQELDRAAFLLNGGQPFSPTPESAIGNYLRKTNAAFGVRTFDGEPYDVRNRNNQKFVFTVGPDTIDDYLAMVEGNANLFENVHSRQSSSFIRIAWGTEEFNRTEKVSSRRMQKEGTIGPTILLSRSEATRMQRFLWLGRQYFDCQYPWHIPGLNFPQEAYSNCASWLQYAPIGDLTLSSITTAGNVDGYGKGPKEPRTGSPTPFPRPQGISDEAWEVLQQVWEVPIHQTLWQVLGLDHTSANGSSSAGFAMSLLAEVSESRVPFVVYYTEDPTHLPEPLDPGILLWQPKR